MIFLVNRFEPGLVDMRINLRGRDVGMSQHFLDDAQRRSVLEQMARKRMPQGVRAYVLFNSCFTRIMLYEFPYALPAEPASAPGKKQDFFGRVLHEQRSGLAYIPAESIGCGV